MTVALYKALTRRKTKAKKVKPSARSEEIWASVRGILKNPKSNAVAYQRKLRREADHVKV